MQIENTSVLLVVIRLMIVNDDDNDGDDDDDDAPVIEGNVECFLGKTIVRQTWVSTESVWPWHHHRYDCHRDKIMTNGDAGYYCDEYN